MALRKNKLLSDLDTLRDNIKKEEFAKTGKTPIVCSDKVLVEIAKKKPLKLSDFLAISGIGTKFMNEYSTRFLKVILSHQTDSVKEVQVSKNAYKVLDHYKDRLTNISRRNPNLYMGKTTNKRSFDLASLQLNHKLEEFLTNKRLKVFPIDFLDSAHGELLERQITTLYRETNKDEKETGSYDLYIGYPYIEGVFKRDQFAIKAPLLYFPVKLIRNKRQFSIKKDKDKDIIYNRDLLLATSKLEQSSILTNVPFIDDFNMRTLRDVVIPYYIKHGIQIKEEKLSFNFVPYKNDVKDDFVKRRKGVFHIEEYITLGRYKLYSSMIQKDMSQILDQNKYNELLEGLIDERDLYTKEKVVVFEPETDIVEERRLSYINEINYSQEKVIDLLHKEKKLVVWGPPGTGKSQTITSLIASCILRGENVLVVSEKKVALDVIYSRLKNTSKYTMFIDDSENKQDFYQKLKTFVHPTPPVRTRNNDIYELEEHIEEIIHTLDESLDLLYGLTIGGVPVHLMYERYVRDKDIRLDCTPKQVHTMFVETFKQMDFKRLEQIESTFKNNRSLREYLLYEDALRKFPLLQKLETKINRTNQMEFDQFCEHFEDVKKQYDQSWFFRRKKIKRDFLTQYQNSLLFLLKKKSWNKKYIKNLWKDDSLHQFLKEHISKLSKWKTKHDKLTPDDRMFLHMLLNHPSTQNVEDKAELRSYLFDAYYTGYLEDFKAHNQQYLYILDKYQETLKKINDDIAEKQQVTTESFEMELFKHALDFSNTKRIMDIKRVLDSTRKMSVRSFIDHFQLELMNHIRIWMMTPEVVSAIIPLVYGMFDVVIFDEASQMYVEKGIPAIYRAKKVVIAGDTKQLRPSSLGIGRLEDDDEFFEEDTLKDISLDAKSLLDLARFKYKETILNYHYRSVYEELIAFSNHAFYDGKLIVSPNQVQPDKPPIEYIHVKNGQFVQRRNEEEAKAVVRLLRKILKERTNNETIGVITFNSAQRDLIENYIDEELFKRSVYQKRFEQELFRKEDGEDKSLFVKNIENVQGDERDIIIFSMGYARNEDGLIRRNFGWLNNEGGQNRLNVAISRAKKKIYFVSSLYPEELKVEDLKSTGPKMLKDYMRYCYYISKNQRTQAKEVLQSLNQTEEMQFQELSTLTKDIKQRLERNHYTVHTDIGIGSYSIDLAVYDEVAQKYLLGVITDVQSNQTINARRDLYHQEKYLEARGWNLYRVFSSNWYTDPNKEMRNIRELLK